MVKDAGLEVVESVWRVYEVGGESPEGQSMLKLGIETLAVMRKGLVERARVISGEEFDEHIRRLNTECTLDLKGSWTFRQTIARRPF
jgi:hypothetical protein